MLLAEAIGNAGATDGLWDKEDLLASLTARATDAVGRDAQPIAPSLLQPSNALAVIVGGDPLTRLQITEQLWAYIFRNRLKVPAQDLIRPDEVLRAVCNGRTEFRSGELSWLVDQHVTPT